MTESIETAVGDAAVGYLRSEAGQKRLRDKVVETVNHAIDESLRYSSPLRKQIDEAVANALKLQDPLNIPSYSHMVVTYVAEQVRACAEGSIQKQVAARLKDILEPIPDVVKLSELIEKFQEQVRDQHSPDWGEFTCRISDSDYGFWYVELDEDADVRTHQCAIRMGFTKEGKLYDLRFRNQDVKAEMFHGDVRGFERLVFGMHAQRSKVIRDIEEGDVDTTISGGGD
jgi:hypothetical protein